MGSTTVEDRTAQATADSDTFNFGEGVDESMAWKADRPGKELVGTLRELGHFVSSYTGEETMRVIVEDGEGQRWSWIPSTQPRRLIVERFLSGVIDIGRPIGIKYVDEIPMRNGSGKLKRFKILPELPESTLRARALNAIKALASEPAEGPTEEATKEMLAANGLGEANDAGLKVPDGDFVDDIPEKKR